MFRASQRYFLLIAALGTLWLAGFIYFLTLIPSSAHYDKSAISIDQAQAIVTLTGGSKRLETAFALFAQHPSIPAMLISGVHSVTNLQGILETISYVPTDLSRIDDAHITIGNTADNTYQNAIETYIWTTMHDIDRFVLVTSNYHMPRALKETSLLLPHATIIPYPVYPERVKIHQWWLYPKTATLIISEYHKYVAVMVRHYVLNG